MWITRVSINNPVFAAMVMVALCVLGLFSYGKLGVEQMPDISFPGAWMEVRYPGASPEAVERELIKPMEEAVNSVAGVKRITSRSGEGQGAMSVEFALDTDMNRAMQEIRDRIAAVQAGFPRDARPPTIARFNNDNSEPVVNMALVGLCPGAASAPQAAGCVPTRSARAHHGSLRRDQRAGKLQAAGQARQAGLDHLARREFQRHLGLLVAVLLAEGHSLALGQRARHGQGTGPDRHAGTGQQHHPQAAQQPLLVHARFLHAGLPIADRRAVV